MSNVLVDVLKCKAGNYASLRDELFVPAVVVTIFIGWRVIAVSFEVGGRICACSEQGVWLWPLTSRSVTSKSGCDSSVFS